MKCTERRVAGVTVVDVEGKLVGGPEGAEFHGLIKRLIARGEKRVVINLEQTLWANSLGIGMLIGALTSITKAGGCLVLANANERIVDILRVTRLLMIFECFTSLEEAVRRIGDLPTGAKSLAADPGRIALA